MYRRAILAFGTIALAAGMAAAQEHPPVMVGVGLGGAHGFDPAQLGPHLQATARVLGSGTSRVTVRMDVGVGRWDGERTAMAVSNAILRIDELPLRPYGGAGVGLYSRGSLWPGAQGLAGIHPFRRKSIAVEGSLRITDRFGSFTLGVLTAL